jgi:hypothetical protein
MTFMDPRPDLADDTAQWERLLERARQESWPLYGILHGLRACGARLHRGRTTWMIVSTLPEYARDRQWLIAYQALVTRLLRDMAEAEMR